MTHLAAEQITVQAGAQRLVDRVSFSVERGEWVTVLGPNGAGKTTLLRAIAGLVRCDGEITLDRRAARPLSQRERARLIALVPQQPLIPAEMTVGEYALLGRTPHLAYLAQEGRADARIAAEALKRLALLPFRERCLGTLSGGELQRALIARALTQRAPILLLDEPTSSLDIGHQQEVLELVDELRREASLTVLATMHDLTLAAQYGERLLLMEAGRVVASGTPAQVLDFEPCIELDLLAWELSPHFSTAPSRKP